MSAATDPLRAARHVIASGIGLTLILTLFVDAAALAVPIYDMQLYDRVLQSRNMNTVALLSVACAAGLLMYGTLEYLRYAAFVTMGETVARWLGVTSQQSAITRAAAEGGRAATAESRRDVTDIQNFLASGALATPLDAMCAPLLLAVLWLLHPAFFWLAVAGIAALIVLGVIGDVVIRPGLLVAAARRSAALRPFALGLGDPDLIEGLGMYHALARQWAGRQAGALAWGRVAEANAHHATAGAKLVRFVFQAGVMAIGVVLVMAHQVTPGALMGANLLLAKTLSPFDGLIATRRRWIEAGAAWRRTVELVRDTTNAAEPVPSARLADRAAASNNRKPGAISAHCHRNASPGRAESMTMSDPAPDTVSAPSRLILRDVGFRAPRSDRTILKGLNLEFYPGTTTAVVGPNGAGKSTLLRLLAGVVRPTHGDILLDGAPASGWDVGYLPQGNQLLDGGISANIARFRDAPIDGAIEAARAAGMHDIIGRLPSGYDTRISDSLASLSGGQRQRIALARALYGAPRLLVLDEPDASLDHVGEDALTAAIDAARARGCIVVVATHRPTLLARTDRRLELRDGIVRAATETLVAA